MTQINPVGTVPDSATCLLSALMYGGDAQVLAEVHDDDLDPAPAEVLAVVRRLAAAGRPRGPQVVLDELRRSGELARGVADVLRSAVTSGADPLAARSYAAAVVAEALRSRAESAGIALAAASATAAEGELAPLAVNAAESVRDCAERLERLRGETL